jgi:hypothetical protein
MYNNQLFTLYLFCILSALSTLYIAFTSIISLRHPFTLVTNTTADIFGRFKAVNTVSRQLTGLRPPNLTTFLPKDRAAESEVGRATAQAGLVARFSLRQLGFDPRTSHDRNQHEAGSRQSLLHISSLFHAGFLLGLCFDPEDGTNIFLGNVDYFSVNYTTLYVSLRNEPQILISLYACEAFLNIFVTISKFLFYFKPRKDSIKA